jgi:outer membrane receptor protein involved in Fe transport
VHALNLTIGDRYSRYSNDTGTTTNAKLAIEWRPIEDLLLRGTVSDVFRAPTVADIYSGASGATSTLSSDPCDGYTGSPANPACVNVPTDGSFRDIAVAEGLDVPGVVSGSAYAGIPLGAENGRTFDYGIVYDPHAIDGLSIGVDVWRLYLENDITSLDGQNVLDACSAGRLAYCPLIHRVPDGPNQGQIATLQQTTGNLGRTDTEGVDLSLDYRLPEFSVGRLRITFNATYTGRYDISTAPGVASNAVYHYAGHLMPFGSSQAGACPGAGGGVCLFPRWRALSALAWQRGSFDASWRMHYIGRFRMGSPAPSQDTFPAGVCYYGDFCTIHGLYFDYGATVYHDIQFGYAIEAINTRVDVGVSNLGDKQPPLLYANNALNANTDPSDFDLLGRFYWGLVTVKF